MNELAAVFNSLYGDLSTELSILLTVIVLDWISGVIKAIVRHRLNSQIGFIGLLKKISYFIIIALACLMDQIVKTQGALKILVIYFFIANEGISIVENIGIIGVPLPKKIKNVLEQLKEENDEHDIQDSQN